MVDEDDKKTFYYICGGLGLACLIILLLTCTLIYYVYNLRRKVKKLTESVNKLKVFKNKQDDSSESFHEVETPFKEPFVWQNFEAPSPSQHQQLQQNLRQSFQSRNPGYQPEEPQSPQQSWSMDEPRFRDDVNRKDSHIPRVLPPTYQGQRNPLANLAQSGPQSRNKMPQPRPFGNQQQNRRGY